MTLVIGEKLEKDFKKLISGLIEENKKLKSSVKEASKIESSEDKEIILEKISETLGKYESFVSTTSEDVGSLESAANSMGLDISDLNQILRQFVKSLGSLEKVIEKNGTSVAGLSEKTTELKTTFSSVTETITSKASLGSDNSENTLSPVLENIKNLNGIVTEISREMNIERKFLETQLMGVENYTQMIEKANLELGQLTSIQSGLAARVESGEFSDGDEKESLINLGNRLQSQIESLERTIVESASSSPNILKMKESFSEFDKTLKIINEDISFREKVTNNLDKKYLSVTEKITDIWKSSTKEVDEELEKIEMEKNLIRQKEIQLNEEVKSLEIEKDTMTAEEYRNAQKILIEKMDELTSSKEKVVSRGEKLQESREEKTFFGKITKTFDTLSEKIGNIKESGSFIGKILLGLTLFGIAVKKGLIDPETTGKVVKFLFEQAWIGIKFLFSALIEGMIFVADALYASIEGTFLEPVLKVIRALAPIATILNIFRWFGKLSGVLLKISNGLNYAFGILGKVLGFFTKIFSFIPFIGKFFAGFAKIFSFVGKFAKGIPVIGQILAVVFAVIDGIVGFFKGFAEGGLLGGIKGAFSQIISGLTFGLLSYDVISEFLTPIFDAIGDFFGAIYDFWAGIFGAFGDFFSSIWNIFGDGETSFMEKIGLVFEALWNLVKDIGKTFLNYLIDTGKALFDLVTYIPRKVGEGMKLIFNKLIDVGPMIWDYIKEIPSMVWEGIKNVFDKLVSIGSIIWDYIKEIPSKIWEGIKSVFDKLVSIGSIIWDYIKEIPSMIKEGIKKKASEIFSIPSMIWNTVSGWVSSWFGGGDEEGGPSLISVAWNSVTGWVSSWFGGGDEEGGPGLISMAWNSVTGWVSSWFGGGDEEGGPGLISMAWDYVTGWISSWFGGAKELLGGAASWVADKAGAVLGVAKNFVGGVTDAVSGAASWVGDKAGAVLDVAKNFVGGVTDAVSGAASWVGEKAGAIVNGVTDAVGSAASWVGEKAGDLWSWGTSWFSDDEENIEKDELSNKNKNFVTDFIDQIKSIFDIITDLLLVTQDDLKYKSRNIPKNRKKQNKYNNNVDTNTYESGNDIATRKNASYSTDSLVNPFVLDALNILESSNIQSPKIKDIKHVEVTGRIPVHLELNSGERINLIPYMTPEKRDFVLDKQVERIESGEKSYKIYSAQSEYNYRGEKNETPDIRTARNLNTKNSSLERMVDSGNLVLEKITVEKIENENTETRYDSRINRVLNDIKNVNKKILEYFSSSNALTEILENSVNIDKKIFEYMQSIEIKLDLSDSDSNISNKQNMLNLNNTDSVLLSDIKNILLETKEIHNENYDINTNNVPIVLQNNTTNNMSKTIKEEVLSRPLRPVNPYNNRLRYVNHI